MRKRKFLYAILLLLALTLVCRTAPPRDDAIVRTIQAGGLTRTYYLHVPPNLPKGKVLPLILLFHGGGGTPAQIDRETKFSEAGMREGFLVACPEGVGKSWNTGRYMATPAERQNVDDLAFVGALIKDVARDYRIDEKRVFATGISNGGIFSEYLAANLSSRIAAIAPVAAELPETSSATFNPEKPVSVLILHGTSDKLVPYEGGDIVVFGRKHGRALSAEETVKKWVARDGCSTQPISEDLPDTDPGDGCRVKRFTYGHGKNGTEVILYRIEGGGHTWPGVTPTLPAFIVGPVCRDINATEIILQFFESHPRP